MVGESIADGGAANRGAPELMRSLLGDRRPRRLDLRLHGIEVEARAFLHRRELDRGHGQLLYLLLDKHEAPELVFEPVEVLLGAVFRPVVGPARAFEWIETKICDVRHVRFGLVTEPAPRLIDEAIFEVIDADGA